MAQRRVSCYAKSRTQKFQNAFYERACAERENSAWPSEVLMRVWDGSVRSVLTHRFADVAVLSYGWPGQGVLVLLLPAVDSLGRGVNLSRETKTFFQSGF